MAKILIIEDEPDLRETLKDLLEIEGFEAATAENGRAGLEKLRETGPPCLIVLDLMMPVMNGWQFLEMLKTQYPDTFAAVPVVVLSAAADLTAVAQQYGCQVMKKPARIAELLQLVRAHCAQCDRDCRSA